MKSAKVNVARRNNSSRLLALATEALVQQLMPSRLRARVNGTFGYVESLRDDDNKDWYLGSYPNT